VQENPVEKQFSAESETYRMRCLGLIMTEALYNPFVLLLIGLSTIITIYIGGMQAIAGQISYGNIAEFVIYVAKLTWPVASLGWVTALIQRAAASQERINEFLKTQPAITDAGKSPVTVIPEKTGKGLQVEFRNVSFTYPDSGIRALNHVSFLLKAGESLAVTGRTGAGKSTIALLLCRLYDVTEGEILINGKDIRQWDLNFLRSHIGYVPQDTFLFSDTIENNILFGAKEKHSGQMEWAARQSGIYEEVMSFREKFRTRIGERGITLSGGQKQRLAIARALIGSAALLIFDDCLSAVDAGIESGIMDNLQKISSANTSHPLTGSAPTVVFISHRVSAVKNSGNILVLHRGDVTEQGTHDSLIVRKGYYSELYRLQQLEAEQEQVG
jgi:ATP-binding cassette subfamily B protein